MGFGFESGMSFRAPSIRVCLAFALVFLMLAGSAFADDYIDVPFDSQSFDISAQLKYLDTDKVSVSVQLPASQGQTPETMTLDAKGEAATYRWAAINLRNLGAEPVDLVMVIPYQGFAGSGVTWPKIGGSRVARVAVSRGAFPAVVSDIGSDSLAIRMEPASNVTIAVQLASNDLAGTALWQRAAFEARTDSFAFFRGVILGIAILMTVVMLSLYAVRSSPAFLGGGVFGLASVCFIAMEAGYLPLLNSYLPEGMRLNGITRVFIEGMMLTSAIFCLPTFLDLRRRQPVLANALFTASVLSLGLVIYGWFDPARATGIIRLVFAVFVLAGFGLVFSMWRQGGSRAQASLMAWSVLAAWTLIAMVAVVSSGNQGMLKSILMAGLTLVLLTMAFTLAQLAFSHGFLSRRFFEEAGRRALALAASQQYIWDWQVDEQDLYVGEEFERALGLRQGFFAETGVDGLLELIHPLDRKAYLSAVEGAERRGKGAFAQEFRIRGGDGIYRWFELRARAMSRGEQRAVRCIGTLTDITDRKRSEDRLLSDAVYDRVTELPNRALLLDRLARAIAQLEGSEIQDLYLLMIDIDRFKALNDGLGHEAGDNLLNVTGRRIMAIAGPNDTVARMPGDQFAVIFIGSSPRRDIIAFTEQIRHAISRPIPMRPHDVTLTASIGVAAVRQQGQQAMHMIRDASVALYEAKRRGKDAVEFFRTSMRDERSELVALEQDLLRAVGRGEIEVFYQPIARLVDMDLAGFEALIRWRHPIHGLLAPETFIGIAEQSGLIRDLGRYVLNEAARQLGIWQRAFRPVSPIFTAVNLSSSELLRADLIDEIKGIIAREGIFRDTFKIEVTESIMMSNPELSVRILERLKDLGVGLACDDFGTGFSSLSTLRRLPFDTLKIDRSFVEAEPEDLRSNMILSSINTLARELGMKIVAEGIATQGQVDRLAGMGCDYGQGYFIGQPMPAKQITEVLSGLPYAASRGKSVIAALWERMRTEPGVLARAVEDDEMPAARRHASMTDEEIFVDQPSEETASAALARFTASRSGPPRLGTAPRAPRVNPNEADPEPPMEEAEKETPAVLDMRKLLTHPAPFAPRVRMGFEPAPKPAEESAEPAPVEPKPERERKPKKPRKTTRKSAAAEKEGSGESAKAVKPKRKRPAKKPPAQA